MDNFGAKLLLLVLAAVHLARSTAAARARVAERPEVDGLAAGLLAPVVIMTLALAANGLAMLQRAYLEAVALAGAPDPAFSSGLLLDQAAVWVGTGALFEIARRNVSTILRQRVSKFSERSQRSIRLRSTLSPAC